MTTLKDRLDKITSKKPFDWKKAAKERAENAGWVNYSNNIAMRILSAIEDNNDINQLILAEKVGVKRQYINKVVKGKQNLSLKTIYKLSKVLGVELITFPDYKYSSNKNARIMVNLKFHSSSEFDINLSRVDTVKKDTSTNEGNVEYNTPVHRIEEFIKTETHKYSY